MVARPSASAGGSGPKQDPGATANQDRPHAGVLAVWPDPPPVELVRFFDLEGYRWKTVDEERGEPIGRARTSDGSEADGEPLWDGAVAAVTDEAGHAERCWRFCQAVRSADTPVLVLVGGGFLDALTDRHDHFDDFIITPFHPQELKSRLDLLLTRAGKASGRGDLVTYGPLTLNVETYQAVVDDRHLDLTYMEYELLRFLASSPGQVFTRETLLNRVWGYEYYGGARTVDVHIRRLRAKMGEDHSSLISTVRGVGYRLGQSRWSA